MRKQSLLSRSSGTYTSPGTPDHQNAGEIQKGWCSERVPLPSTSKRHTGASALMPFNSRTVPSKWDDAERWITSPVSASGVDRKLLVQPQRRPKSKSGPLSPQAVGCFSSYSPAMPVLQGGVVRDFNVGSPFAAGVLVPDCVPLHYGSLNGGLANPVNNRNAMARAASLPGWSDALSEPSLPSSQDEKYDGSKGVETTVSHYVSRRDMATQMSPRESTDSSSPKGRLSFSTATPLIVSTVDSISGQCAGLEIKDLEVDCSATVTRQSRKHGLRKTKNDLPDVKVVTSSWEIAETSKNMSKLQREEAKINAWENLQKAKAEAAIRKLEMKLEKERSASMDKILNKLRIAQEKAQDMRNSASDSYTHPTDKNSHKSALLHTFARTGLLRGCFSCYTS